MKNPIRSLLLSLLLCAPAWSAGFVRVQGTHFTRDGQPYYFLGANFWYGMNLGSRGPGGDRGRLVRELDRLQALGVTNLRIVAGSEGPDSEPWRMVPALQKKPGQYDADLLDGLDFLLSQIGQRGMTAVVVLNNFWPWSGGMAQYEQWRSSGQIPYPPPAPGGDWDRYQKYAARFYSDRGAVKDFARFVKFLIKRENAYTRHRYAEEPAIMAWELANEPRGADQPAAHDAWIAKTAALIKSLDKNHLVTTGSEGETPYPSAGLDFVKNHRSPDVDYATMHIWAANWGWFDPAHAEGTYPIAVAKMQAYFRDHLEKAGRLGKPVVLEEFGISRDSGSYEASAGTALRERYYAAVFAQAYASARSGSPLAGVCFWAWSGEGRPREAGGIWKAGDAFIGDPPHERQGWYGVYDTDAGTLQLIKDSTARFSALNAAEAAR